ncbi:LMBR1 domain-containing protein 2 [Coelomomyces lativittatus]|nr:LMBR1 domain-containing protein 2 [Coelomomyces lativittatus]KAJ1509015.1 LMBR1 domain-containing protein 2 [Coelomomyces lativittatus]
MALSSAYGLLLVVVLMGYGLVDIPRSLWQKANRQRSLELLEMKAPRCHEAMELAKQSLDQVQAEIQTLDTFVPIQDPLRRYVDQMLLVCGLNSPRPHASSLASSQRSTVTLKSLQQMHRKLKLAKLNLARKQQKWRSLISAASYYRSVLNPRPTKHLFHSIQVYIFPYVLKTTSVLAMLFSLMIVWSEIAMNWNLSIFQFLSHTSFGVLMWFTLATLVYMAICLYVPLLHIHVFEKYALTQRHTDVGSLLFFAAYLTRLAFPLSYNVIHLLQVDPVFAVYMGNVNLVPLLGDSFHDWVPLGLCVTTFITLGRWQKKLIQAFNLDPGYMDIDDAQCNRIDGHQLIDQALNQYPWHPTNGSSHLLSHHSPPSASFQSTWPSKGSSTALTDMFVPLGKKIHDPNTVTPLKKNLN